MHIANYISSILLLILLAVLVILLPSVINDSFMSPTQTGKTIFFLSGILVILPVAVIAFLSGNFRRKYSLSWIDLAVSVWIVYIILNSFIKGALFSLSLAEFTGLAVFYVLIRLVPAGRFRWLFFALMAGGLAQAVYGNLQLWGYYPSHHNLFKLTGSFFNPGPYAGFLAVMFPVALGIWIFEVQLTNRLLIRITKGLQQALNRILHWLGNRGLNLRNISLTGSVPLLNLTGKYLAGTALVSTLLVLPASQSRAAWLAVLVSSGFLLITKNKDALKSWLNKSVLRKTAVVLLVTVLMVSGLAGMYFFKKDSADGRTFIWKVTLNMIDDNLLTGAGFGGFKANYMDYQAAWFKQRPQSEEAMVAGDVNYAFNELLQQTAEQGALGTLLLSLLFSTALLVKRHRHPGISVKRQHEKNDHNPLILVSKAVLIAFVVFSMFSYPVQILPVKMGLVLVFAYLAASSPKFNVCILKGSLSAIGTKTTATGIVLTVLVFGIPFLKMNSEALKDWKYAFSVYNMGIYEESVREYEKALPVMQYNGDFMTNYGKALSMAGQHEKAVTVLHEAAAIYPNTVVYAALGDSFKATGKFSQAEAAYLHAWYMNTGRFYPKYLLAKLYDESGQKEKAVEVARELLTKEVKVESTAVEEIKAEMQKILEL